MNTSLCCELFHLLQNTENQLVRTSAIVILKNLISKVPGSPFGKYLDSYLNILIDCENDQVFRFFLHMAKKSIEDSQTISPDVRQATVFMANNTIYVTIRQ